MRAKQRVKRCVECGALTENGTISLTFERDGIKIAISGVPAEICPNGHEPFLDAEVFEAVGAAVTELTRTLSEADDEEDIAAFAEREHEQPVSYKAFLAQLKADGTI